MIICLPAEGKTEDSFVSSSFGRCPYYAFYNTDSDTFEFVSNPAAHAMSGAGIQAAQFVVNKGTKVLLTSNIGPNSGEVLESAGVKIITGIRGTIREAINRFKNGEFSGERRVEFSEPKHEHPAVGSEDFDLEEEIKNLKEAIKVLNERTKKLIEKIEKY